MVIVITGAVGIGKTTVCEQVIETVRKSGHSCGGILTLKTAEKSLTVLDIQTGEKAVLASNDNSFHGPRTPRYSFNSEAIEFGIKATSKAIHSDVLIIDELGHLELAGQGFAESLELVKTGRVKNSILVIRKDLLPAFLAQLGDIPSIFETTARTRDQIPDKICKLLIRSLSDSS